MKKVIIIGCPGSGKSTFARALQKVTKIPLYYLDMMYWNKDKTTVPKDVFHERLQNVLKKEMWIIDGNYGATMEMRLKACDTVFFLDYSVEVCLNGIEERKGKKRQDMPWIEYADEETDKEFVEFIKNYTSENKPKVLALLEKYRDKNIIIFQSRKDADMFLSEIQLKEGNSN